jgi:hypothetical protein
MAGDPITSGLGLTLLGGAGLLQAGSQIMAGNAANKAAKFEAAQLEARGNQELAMKQREGLDRKRQADLLASQAQASSAASGGSLADKSTFDIVSGINAQGDYNMLSSVYDGQTSRNNAYAQAGARRIEGKMAKKSSIIGAAGTLLSTASSGFNQYNRMSAWS